MTDAEKNLAVAEVCGIEVKIEFGVWKQHAYLVKEGRVTSIRFDPLRNANQAVEALDRKFQGAWEVGRNVQSGETNVKGWWEGKAVWGKAADPDPVRAFCAAAVAAILAAGGKG